MIDVSFDQWSTADADKFVSGLTSSDLNKQTIASTMIYFHQFAEYLIVHDYISDDPLKKYREMARVGQHEYKATAVNRATVNRIFNVLGDFNDKQVAICFLVVYCVGMRISEAIAIKADCLESRPTGHFIKYYSLKMKKEVVNAIPPSLYDIIDKYIKENNLRDYLFPSSVRKNAPISVTHFYDTINCEFQRLDVINPDGTPYHFSAHSFRHLMAVRMREQKIPFQFIQEQLHHSSPEMTLAYLEYIDRKQIAKISGFINNSGVNQPIGDENPVACNKEEYAEHMRKYLNAQMLPNGICARPIKLGKCPHENLCLSCPEFRTSVAYLETHRKHLSRVEESLQQAETNGWLPQIESNKNLRNKLLNIIDTLENMDDASNE